MNTISSGDMGFLLEMGTDDRCSPVALEQYAKLSWLFLLSILHVSLEEPLSFLFGRC
jgi:hypothetical protein